MDMEVIQCPKCGAPTDAGRMRCSYCGSFLKMPRITKEKSAKARQALRENLLGPNGEFGLQGRLVLFVGIGLAVALYFLGWLFEDTHFWLQERAIVIWAGVLPVWWFIFALAWRPKWGGWLMGLAIGILIFAIHLVLMCSIRGQIRDDYVGISFIFAFASMAGWYGGRIVHLIVCKARERGMVLADPPDQSEKG